MTLPEYLKALETRGSLKRISCEVDPDLEISEIIGRLYRGGAREKTPALLFEKVKGSSFPLVINLLGTADNIRLALGDDPENLSARIAASLEDFKKQAPNGKIASWIWNNRGFLRNAMAARPKTFSDAIFKEVVKYGNQIDLGEFPVLKCWPKDGGKFITAGLVFTKSPVTGERNCGIYRLQVYSKNEIGLHWQIQKGGGFHFAEAQKLNQPLEVAVALGCDPLLWLSAIFPLPEGMDEMSIAGFLRGKSVEMAPCDTVSLEVPRTAEIVIEGIARPGRTAMEGPFGDHFGHYSHASPFPVLEIQSISHKKNAVFHAAVVGKPPQEDKAMGEAVSKIFHPLIKLIKPELHDLWAYFEAGFHNLLAASVKQRYEKEGIKVALGLLGEGQLSLTKCLILTDPFVSVSDFRAVLRAVRDHFSPEEDFILLPGTSQDTLDFTGPKINRGSKMILDATNKNLRGEGVSPIFPSPHGGEGWDEWELSEFRKLDSRILEWKILEDCLLAVKVNSGRESAGAKDALKKILERSEVQEFKIIALVSEDVPLNDDVLLIWGIFTRFDCERDILFSKTELRGARAVHSGPLGIDATWKKGYPEPVEMSTEVIEKVSRRWKEYG